MDDCERQIAYSCYLDGHEETQLEMYEHWKKAIVNKRVLEVMQCIKSTRRWRKDNDMKAMRSVRYDD